jgi:hypothetical protein
VGVKKRVAPVPTPEPVVSADVTIVDLSPAETKKRKAKQPPENGGTVLEKRMRILAHQKDVHKSQRSESTRIDQFDTEDHQRIDRTWTFFYDRCTQSMRRTLYKKKLLADEIKWLKAEMRRDECADLWFFWISRPDQCNARIHSPVVSREGKAQFEITPNAVFYDKTDEAKDAGCICYLKGTILLCNDLSHRHSKCGWQTQISETHKDVPSTFNFERRIESIDRYRDRLTFASFNQNIVATNIFGLATQQVWDSMLRIANRMFTPPHSIMLFNNLDSALAADPSLTALRYCIDCFSIKSWQESRKGKPRDRRFSLLPATIYYLKGLPDKKEFGDPLTVRDAGYLDANHPFHSRFDARDANETTLGLLLFVESTGNTLWQKVWDKWREQTAAHCEKCQPCRIRFVEFLSCLVLLFEMTPGVVELSFAEKLEDFLRLIKRSK